MSTDFSKAIRTADGTDSQADVVQIQDQFYAFRNHRNGRVSR
jgi:hypothetical protein